MFPARATCLVGGALWRKVCWLGVRQRCLHCSGLEGQLRLQEGLHRWRDELESRWSRHVLWLLYLWLDLRDVWRALSKVQWDLRLMQTRQVRRHKWCRVSAKGRIKHHVVIRGLLRLQPWVELADVAVPEAVIR